MSICPKHINEYELIIHPSNHNIPSEISAASCLAISDTSLILINNGSDQLLLYDLSVSSLKLNEISWPSDDHGRIRDICWANYINAFLILGDDALCSYSPMSNELIVQLKSPSLNNRFWSLTVLNYDVYVLYRHDSLQRYCLPSWILRRSWLRTDLIDFCMKENFIQTIRANPSIGVIALLVRLKHHRQWRINLYDRRMQKLYSGEYIRMTSAYPNIKLQPYGENGFWMLINDEYIWRIDSKGHSIERQPRKPA